MYAQINPQTYKKQIKDATTKVVKSTFDTLIEFKNFIVSRGIVSVAIGLIIASQVNVLTKSMSQGIIDPIISKFLTIVTKDLSAIVITIFSVDFKIGMIVSDLINLLFVVIFVFLIWKLTNYVYTKYEKKITTTYNKL
jgi:large-conductance mechanosensitive channel